jgi:hypothetical protein
MAKPELRESTAELYWWQLSDHLERRLCADLRRPARWTLVPDRVVAALAQLRPLGVRQFDRIWLAMRLDLSCGIAIQRIRSP